MQLWLVLNISPINSKFTILIFKILIRVLTALKNGLSPTFFSSFLLTSPLWLTVQFCSRNMFVINQKQLIEEVPIIEYDLYYSSNK